ncbi:MAG: hypothetical protein DRQ01_06395 [Ignavibacteriae bacterium]|nr:MAG: hypothetical protein DRQ01_06395 [Ignavibacteriota bacterium]
MLRYFPPFFFITTIYAQALDGFPDIKWKAFKQQVRYSLLNTTELELKDDDNDVLTFTGGTFADNSVSSRSFYFFENRFYYVDVILDTIDGQDAAIWSKTLTYLETLYGKSDDFLKIDKNQSAIYWKFYDFNGEPESMIQLTRTFRGDLESGIKISYTYLPLFIRKEESEE